MGSDFIIVGVGALALVAGFVFLLIVVAFVLRRRGAPVAPILATSASPELGQSFRGLNARADDRAFAIIEDDFATNRARRIKRDILADMTGDEAPNGSAPAPK